MTLKTFTLLSSVSIAIAYCLQFSQAIITFTIVVVVAAFILMLAIFLSAFSVWEKSMYSEGKLRDRLSNEGYSDPEIDALIYWGTTEKDE